jgi:hypothetical protein
MENYRHSNFLVFLYSSQHVFYQRFSTLKKFPKVLLLETDHFYLALLTSSRLEVLTSALIPEYISWLLACPPAPP